MGHNLELVQRVSRLASLREDRGLDDAEMDQAIQLVRRLTPRRVRALRWQWRWSLVRLFWEAALYAFAAAVLACIALWVVLSVLVVLGVFAGAFVELVVGPLRPPLIGEVVLFFVTCMPAVSVLFGVCTGAVHVREEWPGSARAFVDEHLKREF